MTIKQGRLNALQGVLNKVNSYKPEHIEAYDNHYGLIR